MTMFISIREVLDPDKAGNRMKQICAGQASPVFSHLALNFGR